MPESALYDILRPILGFIRVLFCYADKSSDLCNKKDYGILSCLHKGAGGSRDFS